MVRDMEEGVAAAEVDDERAERRREEVEAEREEVEAERERVWVGSSEEWRDGEATAGGSVHRAFLMNEGRRSSTSCLCEVQVVASASSHLFFCQGQLRSGKRKTETTHCNRYPSKTNPLLRFRNSCNNRSTANRVVRVISIRSVSRLERACFDLSVRRRRT